jgi:hypothetical protein
MDKHGHEIFAKSGFPFVWDQRQTGICVL